MGFTDVSINAKNEIFFRRGLDDPNQLEFAREISVYVKSNFWPGGWMRAAIAARDCRRVNQCELRYVIGLTLGRGWSADEQSVIGYPRVEAFPSRNRLHRR